MFEPNFIFQDMANAIEEGLHQLSIGHDVRVGEIIGSTKWYVRIIGPKTTGAPA